MERLTVKCDDGHWGLSLTIYDKAIPSRILEKLPIAIDRLAAYEDTGLEPEEVSQIKLAIMGKSLAEIKEFEGVSINRMIELTQAEKDERLVVLPCKVGDMVWCISRAYKTISQYTAAGYLNDGFRWKVRMKKTIPSWVGNKTEHKYVAFNAFGKTVFLTREEAEAALKKREEDNEAD